MLHNMSESVPLSSNNSLVLSTENESLAATDYYYYYDYDASVSQIPLEELVPVAMVYGITLVLGILGNGLVIFAILRNRRMQTVTNMFLVSLASADLLIVVMCVPIKVCIQNEIKLINNRIYVFQVTIIY